MVEAAGHLLFFVIALVQVSYYLVMGAFEHPLTVKKESAMLKHILTIAMIIMISACSSDDDDDPIEEQQPPQFSASQTFEVVLNGHQQVPMVDSMATAMATVEVDESLMLVKASLNTENIEGFSAAHIHQGGIGLNGDVAFAFSAAGSGLYEVAETTVTQTQIDDLLDGQWYINVHTDTFPDGEVRGQIVDSDTSIITFKLNGKQEVPAVETEAMGHGYATYHSTSMELVVRAVTMGLDDATAAHIHTGNVGMNGGVLVGLIQNTAAMNTWETPEDTMIDADTLATFMAGGHYVNIHTSTVASGELRGQILTDNYALITFELTGGQEVPAVNTDAWGDGYALVNTDDYSLWLNIVTMGVDDATMAHIHTGEFGSNGGALVTLEQSTDDLNVWMTPANTMIDADIFATLAAGGHYVNVHTPGFPSGELRGQILMDNYHLSTFNLSGKQEVPMVMTDASGSGYALVDKMDMTLDVKVVTEGLTDASMAHIHTGRVGMNGGVLAALSQSNEDSNVWMTAEPVTVDAATYDVFAAAGHYVNVHSTTNASGELRGQILMANHELMTFAIDGEQEVPAVTTDAMGSGYALVDTDTMMLEVVAVTSGVDDATMAHIHTGRVGNNGGVLVSLEQAADDPNVWMTPNETVVDMDTYTTLKSGGHYVNIHTPEVTSGELRGQILADNFTLFTFELDGAQQNSSVVTSARGDGYALVNSQDYALELTVVTTGVSDATSAHIHSGYADENGDVLVGLEQSMADDNIWMTASGLMLDADTYNVLIDGGHYVNIHTPLFPSGEIRGQIE